MYRDKIYKSNSEKFKITSEKMLILLTQKSMTKHELAEEMELNHSTISNYIFFLKRKGMIYISEWKENPLGKATAKYKFGSNDDAEFVARRKYKSNYRSKSDYVNLKMPRCDIAASWMNNPC